VGQQCFVIGQDQEILGHGAQSSTYAEATDPDSILWQNGIHRGNAKVTPKKLPENESIKNPANPLEPIP
jgi:hypothetical protein